MRKVRFIVFLAALISGIVYVSYQLNLKSKSVQSVVIDVSPGTTLLPLSQELQEKGLISSAQLFYYMGRLFSYAEKIKVGEYELHSQMSYPRIFSILSSGSGILRSISIPEGYNMYQIADVVSEELALSREEFLSLAKNPQLIKSLLGVQHYSLEGYLFPETYNFSKYTAGKDVIKEMVNNFLSAYSKIEKGNLRPGQIHRDVILASMIEKESGSQKEYSIISSVFHNRLKRKMRLQSDPTIIYGVLDKTGVTIKNIQRKHIQERTDFNTYRIPALPKGPIANPGYSALYAVKYPQETEYLYFVSKNNGEHVFSKTYEEHREYVKTYQLRR